MGSKVDFGCGLANLLKNVIGFVVEDLMGCKVLDFSGRFQSLLEFPSDLQSSPYEAEYTAASIVGCGKLGRLGFRVGLQTGVHGADLSRALRSAGRLKHLEASQA